MFNFGIPAGQGVNAGGFVNQVLVKKSNTDYDTTWQNLNTGTSNLINNSTGNPIGIVNPSNGAVSGTFFTRPTGTNSTAIQAAIDYMYSLGGGTVYLDAIEYTITAPVVLKSKVSLIGVNPSLTYGGIPDFYSNTKNGGTWFVGNGTCNLLTVNDTDLSSQFSTPAAFSNAAQTDVIIKNIGLYNGIYGLKVGGNFYPGVFYGTFENIMAYGCSQWGIWIENCIHNTYDKFNSWGNTVGQVQFRSSSVSQGSNPILAPGNCQAGEILASCPFNLLSRGIEITATNGTWGGVQATVFQGNRFNNPPTVTQTATGNGSTSLQVTDTTKFIKDAPIIFTSVGATGLTANSIYFVTSIIDATHMTITDRISSQVNTTISSGTATLVFQGFAPVAAYGYTTQDRVGATGIVDAEAGGTSKYILADAIPGGSVSLAGAQNDSSSTVDASIKNSQYTLFTNAVGARIDLDGGSTTGNVILGVCTFTGIFAVPVFGGGELNLSTFRGTDQLSNFITRSPGGGGWTYPGQPLGVHQGSYPYSLTFGIGFSTAGFATYTGSGAATFTFSQGLSSAMKGFRQTFKNMGTGALTVVLNNGSGTSYTFDNISGKTSVVLSAKTSSTYGGSLTIVCCEDFVGGYYWCVESIYNGI